MASSAKETIKAANVKVARDLGYMKEVLSTSFSESKSEPCKIVSNSSSKGKSAPKK